MNRQKIAAGMLLVIGLAAPCGAAERLKVIKESMTVEGHRSARDPASHKVKSLKQIVDVVVYRPNDNLKHPAIVYLHGGGMSFADPLMDRFHAELASRGLVVLAPHYLLDGTGWTHWQETAEATVTLATKLPSVDPDHIGMSGISMGGQIGLSTAARDPRIKAVAEYFTAWPGSLPDEPIDHLPPVLLLNGTADPIIPLDKAMALDEILKKHKLPFQRHIYEGVGHGFGTPAAFRDGLARTAAFFGGKVDGSGSVTTPVKPITTPGSAVGSPEEFSELNDEDDDDLVVEDLTTSARDATPVAIARKGTRRLAIKKPTTPRSPANPSPATRP